MDAFPRRLKVCRDNGCVRCSPGCCSVPDDCPFGVLHALVDEGLITQPRRSGKTTQAVSRANALALQGHRVYLLVWNRDTAKLVRERFRVEPGVKVLSWRQVENGALRTLPGVVLTDELREQDVDRIRDELRFHNFEGGSYTPF